MMEWLFHSGSLAATTISKMIQKEKVETAGLEHLQVRRSSRRKTNNTEAV